MNNFNQFAPQQPQQHPISSSYQPQLPSVGYETVLSPQHSLTTPLNNSGPVFNFPFCNQYPNPPCLVPMQPSMGSMGMYPNMSLPPQIVPYQQVNPTNNSMTPPVILLQSPSPLPPYANQYFQPSGYNTPPVRVAEMCGQLFPIPMSEGMPEPETRSQSSGSSDQASGHSSPQHEPLPPPVPTTQTVRPPPGFTAKRCPLSKPSPTSISWSERARQKIVKSTVTTPKREQPVRMKKDQSPKTVKPARKKRTKFGYRSKQNKIDTVHENLEKRYAARGILADNKDVLRGEDVLRLHVKKYDALNKIEQILEKGEKLPNVSYKKMSMPLSMKNEFQKKGFLVYCQLSNVEHVDIVKKFFQSHPEFSKCQTALPNLETRNVEQIGEPDIELGEPTMTPVQSGSPELAPLNIPPSLPHQGEKDNFSLDDEDDIGLDLAPMPMLKNASLASVGC